MTLIDTSHQVLNTDLYQLTMAAGYFCHGLAERRATFELYVRKLPPQRSFLLAAGLEQAIDYLRQLRFDAAEIEAVRSMPMFAAVPAAFFDYLATLRFDGDVWALPEGTVFFPYQPILRISAPLIQAQLIETWLLAMVNYQTSVASKAARIQLAIENAGSAARFIDFGSRRAHGPQAALLAARAAWIGGAVGTSNVLASRQLEIPVVGTAAHAWTMAFACEPEAFAAYREIFPQHSTLLVDTYDTLQGVRHAIASGQELGGIRLDSGDFLTLSRQARQLLDQAGMERTRIVVSGDMNEYKVRDLLAAGAPIDQFGIGTELVTSIDAPSLGGVYKLVEVADGQGGVRQALKLSGSKISYPGRKQIWRRQESGRLMQDTLGLADEALPGLPLLQPVMRAGTALPLPNLAEIQVYARAQLASLPAELRQLEGAAPTHLELSPALLENYRQLKLMTLEKENA